MNAVAELFRELFISGFMASLIHVFVNQFKGQVRHTGETAGKSMAQAAEKSHEEHRSELLNFLRNRLTGVDQLAAQNIEKYLEARRHAPYKPGSENIAVAVLVDLYMHLNESTEEQDRIEIFRTLGRGTQEQFDQAIDFLNNDVAWQWFLTLLNTLGEGSVWTKEQIKDLINWARKEENIKRVRQVRSRVAKRTAKTVHSLKKGMEDLGLGGEYVPPLQVIYREIRQVFRKVRGGLQKII